VNRLKTNVADRRDSCTFETLCLRFAISDPIISEIAEMVHEADLEYENSIAKRRLVLTLC
jgi:hypothetical protein